MADIIFTIYLIGIVVICLISFTPRGKNLMYEFLAFRDTKRYLASQGIRWPE